MSRDKGKSAVNSKIMKTVRIVVIHQKPVDLEVRKRVTKTTSKISGLWKEDTIIEGRKSWTLLVEPARERKEESVFKVGIVLEDMPDKHVLQKILEGLKADGWSSEIAM